jgi:opacity protein-like surface antigen
MKRFIIAAAIAVALGLGSAATASAQYVIPYGGYTPNGGIVTGSSIYDLGGYQSYNTYYSPYGTVRQQAFLTNGYSSFGVAQGYNPYTGFGYNRSYYSPAPGLYAYPITYFPGGRIPAAYPLGGYGGYGFHRR